MEAIKQTVTDVIRSNNQTPTSSTATVITPDAEKILGTIIFRTRLAKGWNGYEPRTQAMAVQTWHEILQTEKVPHQVYDELYRRACNFQAFILQTGKEPPEMSAQLMLSQWIGESGLRKELAEREIKSGKFLGENAESVCRYCHGSGWRTIKEGNYSFAKKCDHRD